jgi:diamine N-acetyltransferase
MIASLLEATADTVRAICALQTTEEQKRFVAPNALSIAQAYFEPTPRSERFMPGKHQSVFLCGV